MEKIRATPYGLPISFHRGHTSTEPYPIASLTVGNGHVLNISCKVSEKYPSGDKWGKSYKNFCSKDSAQPFALQLPSSPQNTVLQT